MALSGRPIRAVHRIWADGKLLRGSAGDWKSETGYRLYPGDEAQPVDPLLAAVEGASGTPAYRDLAYAVFEDMQLADFGNRIPSLTFEVEADAAPVSLGTIAAELSRGAVDGNVVATLGGYAASGDSVRGALEALSQAIPLSVYDDGTRLRLSDVSLPFVVLPEDALGATSDDKRAQRRSVDRQASGTLPDEVTVTYYEPARDYQAGLQRARRGGPGRRVEAIELAAALDAGAAKAVAERRLADNWAERSTGTVTLPWRWLDVRPGSSVRLGDGARWRVSGWTLEGMALTLRLRAQRDGPPLLPTAQAGRATGGVDAPHGPTTVALVDLPPLDDSGTTPRLWLAAAGVSAGWRRAAVIASSDGGASWNDAGATAAPAVMGVTVGMLRGGDAVLFDGVATVDVDLLNADMTLTSRDDDALVDGANLALIGSELVQFGRAELLGGLRWRLSRLLRGRRGTEAATGLHGAGDRFVLIEPDSLLPIEIPTDRIGAELRVIASGVADPLGVEASAVVSGRALRPPVPVHLRAAPMEGGGLRLSWTRRSRSGWAWTDGGDVPLAEEAERYRIEIVPDAGRARTVETIVPSFAYDSAAIAADGAAAATSLVVTLVQLGAFGASLEPASATFTFAGETA